MGEWLLRTTCVQANQWHQAGHTDLQVAVNVSVRQLRQANLAALIETILLETQLAPQAIELEITESIAMLSQEFSPSPLMKLDALGVHLSIDDFGTGYSSLSRLKTLPVKSLKIDQSFVNDIATDEDDRTIIGAMIAMAHALGLKVTAEGVETQAQLEFLREHGCDEAQGFLFSQPVTARQLTSLLQTNFRSHLEKV